MLIADDALSKMDQKPNFRKLLYDAYVKAYTSKTKLDCQKEVNNIWSEIKKDVDNIPTKVDSLLKEYEAIAKKKKGTMMIYWADQTLKKTVNKSGCPTQANSLRLCWNSD